MRNERELMEKNENFNQTKSLRKENVVRVAKLHEYHREVKFEKIQDRFAKVDDFLNYKSLIAGKRREIQDEFLLQKEKHVGDFEKKFVKTSLEVKNMLNI